MQNTRITLKSLKMGIDRKQACFSPKKKKERKKLQLVVLGGSYWNNEHQEVIYVTVYN